MVLKQTAYLVLSKSGLQAIGWSILRWTQAFTVASIAGGLAGGLAFQSQALRHLLRPIISAIRSIPVIAAILIALIWVPLETVSILVGFLVAFPLMYQGVLDGLLAIDYRYIELGYAFDLPAYKMISRILFPGSLPVLISAIIGAVGMSWKATIAAEVLSQPLKAIGTELFTAKMFIDTSSIFAWTLIAVVTASILDSLLHWLQQRILRLYRPHPRLAKEIAQAAMHESAKFPPAAATQDQHPLPTLAGLACLNSEWPAPIGISFSSLSFSHASGNVFADLNLTIQPGTINVIFGPSGCGKTTLLRLAAGLLHPQSGRINFWASENNKTKTIEQHSLGASVVFQDSRLLPWMNIKRNINLPLKGKHRDKQELASEMLDLVHVPFPQHFPDQLSGGMQQRVNLARCFLNPAGLICLDEPFANQDRSIRADLMNGVIALQRLFKPTILWVTHDPGEAIKVADRIIMLDAQQDKKIAMDSELHGLLPEQRQEIFNKISSEYKVR